MTLKFPCRQFLHLAAGAAGRIASREGASVSVAAGAYRRRLCGGGGGCSNPVSCVTIN